MMKTLEEIRKEINEIDAQIATLFERRMSACAQVAAFKQEKGLGIVDRKREAEVIDRNAAFIQDGCVREYYINLEQKVMELSRAYQERLMVGMKVAYCGVPGAFAHTAAGRMFPGAQLIAYPGFDQAYEACENGECDATVLPFENSSAGEVSSVTDLMFAGNLYVNQSCELEAVQNLLGCEGATLETIKDVVSHPQALSQCAPFIKEFGFNQHEYTNTAVAAKMVAEKNDPTLAAIASEESARIYGLKIVKHRINSSSNNKTRFAALSRVRNDETSRGRMDRRSILMFTVKNEAGALATALNIIGSHNYNMCNLRSRPLKDLLWSYYFYVELDGDINSSEGREMMIELGSICDRLKILGTF